MTGIITDGSGLGNDRSPSKLLGVVTSEKPEQVSKETWEDLFNRVTGVDPRICPHCGKGK